MRSRLPRAAVVAVALLFACGCGATSVPPITIGSSRVPTIAGAASFDDVEIDQSAHRLYAADRTDQGIDVFDTSSTPAAYLKTVALNASPNGLAIAPDLGRVFAGIGDGSVVIVDTNPNSPTFDTVIGDVPTGGKSVDLIDYAPGNHTIYASNGDQGSIASIDATTGQVTATFALGHALEQPRFNPTDGMLYVTSPDADAVIVVDPRTGAIKTPIKLGPCFPHGLAINPKSDQALIACHDSVIRESLRNPADAEAFSQVVGGDIVTYDAAIDRFLVAAPGLNAGGAVGLFGGNPIAFVRTVTTGGQGNSAAYDEATNLVYTPDTRSGRAGLASFQPPTTVEPIASLLPSLWPFAAGVAMIALFLALVARGADPARRPAPPEPRPAVAPAVERPRNDAVK